MSDLQIDHMPPWASGGDWDGWEFRGGTATRCMRVGSSIWAVHIRGCSLHIGGHHQYCESAAHAKRIANAVSDDRDGWA